MNNRADIIKNPNRYREALRRRGYKLFAHYHATFDEKQGGWRVYEGVPRNCFLCKEERGKP
jgi:hypothetical protein